VSGAALGTLAGTPKEGTLMLTIHAIFFCLGVLGCGFTMVAFFVGPTQMAPDTFTLLTSQLNIGSILLIAIAACTWPRKER
jgi:hypothetical protein